MILRAREDLFAGDSFPGDFATTKSCSEQFLREGIHIEGIRIQGIRIQGIRIQGIHIQGILHQITREGQRGFFRTDNIITLEIVLQRSHAERGSTVTKRTRTPSWANAPLVKSPER